MTMCKETFRSCCPSFKRTTWHYSWSGQRYQNQSFTEISNLLLLLLLLLPVISVSILLSAVTPVIVPLLSVILVIIINL